MQDLKIVNLIIKTLEYIYVIDEIYFHIEYLRNVLHNI